MDVNQVITLGIGTPSDIPHFLTFGLSIGEAIVIPEYTRVRHVIVRPASLAVDVEVGSASRAKSVACAPASRAIHVKVR